MIESKFLLPGQLNTKKIIRTIKHALSLVPVLSFSGQIQITKRCQEPILQIAVVVPWVVVSHEIRILPPFSPALPKELRWRNLVPRASRFSCPFWRCYYILPETHKGLKRVTLVCLLCPMLVIIHFQKYHIWNEKKR